VRLSVPATGVVVGEGPIVWAHAAPGVQRFAPGSQKEVGDVFLEPVEQRQHVLPRSDEAERACIGGSGGRTGRM
jgi:hypothetical protein